MATFAETGDVARRLLSEQRGGGRGVMFFLVGNAKGRSGRRRLAISVQDFAQKIGAFGAEITCKKSFELPELDLSLNQKTMGCSNMRLRNNPI